MENGALLVTKVHTVTDWTPKSDNQFKFLENGLKYSYLADYGIPVYVVTKLPATLTIPSLIIGTRVQVFLARRVYLDTIEICLERD